MIYSFALFVVPWLEEFGATRSEIMLVIFLQQVMIGILSPLSGRLLDHHSIRLMVAAGGLSVATGLLLLSQATAVWQIVVIYGTLFPLGMVLAGPLASQTLVSKWFRTNRSMAIGISSMGTSMGGFAFPLIAGSLIHDFGWQQAAIWLAAISIALVVPATIWILRRSPPEGPVFSTQSSGQETKRITTKEILSSRKFWIPVLGLIPINVAFGGIQFNLGAYMRDLGFEQSAAAVLISVMSVSMIVGKFIFGSLGDRVDHRKLYWLMAALLFCALGLYMTVRAYEGLLLAAAFQGFATGGVMPMMGIMYASRFETASFGKVLGLVNMFLMTGSFGSLFSGWIFDTTGSYLIAFTTFTALLVPACICMIWLPSHKSGT